MMQLDDFRERPRYGVTEAARYIGGGMRPATLRTWVAGRRYDVETGEAFSAPLIQLPTPADRPVRLSFTNLIEAHVLNALRQVHDVHMHIVRRAIEIASWELGVDRLLIRRDLRTNGRGIFINHLGALIDLSRSCQIALEDLLEDSLQQVHYGSDQIASRLFPKVPSHLPDRAVAIDPLFSSGRPFLPSKGVSVAVLVERLDEGESLGDVAKDYELNENEIRAALAYADAA